MSEAEVHDSLEATQLAQGQYQVVENPNIATHDEQVQTLLQIDAKCDELQVRRRFPTPFSRLFWGNRVCTASKPHAFHSYHTCKRPYARL